LLKALKNKRIEIEKETTKAKNKHLGAQPTDDKIWTQNTHIKESRKLYKWTQRVNSRDIPNYKIGII
jgi:hypothetical protein